MWLSRNDIVFYKANHQSYLHILFRTTHWIRPRPYYRRRRTEKLFQKLVRLWRRCQWMSLRRTVTF
ncbi:hypothetical protein HU200_032808 [Digitaria exilis]|uniref:Uncharacterized protein n=1 Tax=Digitaria exilis TaxID=1010633 RepID=A0A835BJ47_9POAL|nr:hypothetical protein HU200_032808 [Digitaria exilis]